MLESHINMAQVKQRPQKLLRQKADLQQQVARIQAEIQVVDQNFKLCNSYI